MYAGSRVEYAAVVITAAAAVVVAASHSEHATVAVAVTKSVRVVDGPLSRVSVLKMMVFEFWAVWSLLVLCLGSKREEGNAYVGIDEGLGVILLGGLGVLRVIGLCCLGLFVRLSRGVVFVRLSLGLSM